MSTLSRLGLFSAILLLSSCNNEPKIPENDPGFGDYIAAHTSGVISAYDKIQFEMIEDINPGVTPGTLVETEIIEFDPDIEGTITWESPSSIVFTPDEPLPSGASFQGVFHLSAILEVPSEFKDYDFLIQVIPKDYDFLDYQIDAQDDKDLAWNSLEGEISSSDRTTIETVSEDIQFDGYSKEEITWTYESSSNRFSFRIDSVERKAEGYDIEVRFGDEVLETMRVPGLNEFEVLSVTSQQIPRQAVTISFSDPLKESQVTTGLFQLDGEDVTSLTISGSRVTLYPNSRLNGSITVTIAEGIENSMGFRFPKTYTTNVLFQARKPEIQFVDDGNIVPMTGAVKIPFKAVNLQAVDVRIYKVYTSNIHQFFQVNDVNDNNEFRRVARPIHQQKVDLTTENVNYGEWNTFAIDLNKMVTRDPGAVYRVEMSFQKAYSLYPCDEDEDSEPEPRQEMYDVNADYFSPYYNNYYSINGYDYQERDNPCHVSYYNSSHIITKNILASNLGLIVKGNDGKYSAYVTSLDEAKGFSGIDIVFYNYQGQEIVRASTNSEGAAYLETDAVPFRAEAQRGKERGYITLDPSKSLSVSNFDVGGSDVSSGIQAYMYGERGVWRPGDTIFLNAILNDEDNPLPANHPMTFTVKDPEGKQVYRKVTRRGTNVIFPFHFTTDREGKTGFYSATLEVGGKNFYKSLSVETVQPNRFDIEVTAEDEVVSPENNTISVHAEWLTGAQASGMKTIIDGRLTQDYSGFEGYDGYHFRDLTRSTPSLRNSELYNGNLDMSGNKIVEPDFGNLNYAPGMLNLNLTTKVFEPSGRFSVNGTSVKVAPFTSFVGIKMPERNQYGYYETEKKHVLRLANVGPTGEAVSGRVKVTIYKVSWSWWWSARRGNSTYLNNSSQELIKEELVNTVNGEARMEFSIGDNHWGRMLIVAEDVESGHRSSQLAYIDWGWGRDRSGRAGGESVNILNVQSDKEKYNVGDVAQISVPSSAGGRLILSIEGGRHQIEDHILTTEAGRTVFKLPITADMAPNAYVHAMILQPHEQTANDLPVRLYGIMPIMVEDPNTRLTPVIETVDEIRPESTLNVKVSEENGKEMEYTIALVDEGLLGLTNYKTPQPWDYFYARRSLGVRTWDMYDYVLNAFGGQIARMLAVGGDGALNPDNERGADRFVPVVRHLGPFKLKAGSTADHQVSIPNYIGRVRVMVVAANQDEAYGSAEEDIRVVQPLMAQLTMPRVLGPGEEVKIPVTVFAMNDNIRNVRLQIETTGLLSAGSTRKDITFDGEGQQTVFFEGKVAEGLGLAAVKMTATSGRERSTDEIEISVRSPISYRTEEFIIDIDKGQTITHTAEPFGVDNSNTLTVEVSSLPALNLGERLDYLIGYPHGCLEQTTSKSFAQLNLEKWVEISADQKAEIKQNVREGIYKLRRMQHSNGGFRYWPSHTYADHWATTYAGHFLIEAERSGYALPEGMKEGYLRYASQAARNWYNATYYGYNNDLNQAYRLYVLALAGEPEIGAMNRMRNKSNLTRQAASRLALAFVLIDELDAARELMAAQWTAPDNNYYYYSYGSSTRDLAMDIETYLGMGNRSEALRLSRELITQLSEGYASTQTIAYSLQTLSKIYDGDGDSNLEVDLTIGGEKHEVYTSSTVVRYTVEDFDGEIKVEAKNLSNNPVYIRVLRNGVPHYGSEQAYAERITMSTTYIDPRTNEPLDVTQLKVGDPIRAVVKLSRPNSSRDYDNLALTQIFPSGWEITNSRMIATATNDNTTYLDYQDIRDDRVLSYFSMYGYNKQSVTLTVDLTASYPGKWYLPPTTIEAMYNDAVKASNQGRWVEVAIE